MLHLTTLGGLSVAADGIPGGGAGHQRKTLALLALLASAGSRGLSRDKLIGYLWPDADAEHGRGLLKQACYALRRDLHAHDLFLGATELRLNPAIMTSDVQLFETALAQGDLSRAAALYAGEFLDGFYLNDSAEFEHWMEAERERLRRRAENALEKLATAAGVRGDHRDAVEYWRRLYQLDPLNSRVALNLMHASVAAGDPAGALEVAHEHEARLREELEVGPDPAVVDLAQRLRAQAPPRESTDRSPPSRRLVPDLEKNKAEQPLSRWGFIPLPGKLVLAVLAAAAVAAALFMRAGRVPPLDPNLVAVAPFEIVAPNAGPWKEGLLTVLSGSLEGVGPLRAVAPSTVVRHWHGRADRISAADLGRRTGARFVLYGALIGAGRDSVRLTATLIDAASGISLAELGYRDAMEHVARLTDSVAGAVQRELGLSPETVSRFVSFKVLGPDGRSSICEYLPVAAIVTARLLNATPPPRQGGFDAFACPESRLQLSVPASGRWHVRVDLPAGPGTERLPITHIEEANVSHDIVIREGSRLGGHATFEGRQVEGVAMVVGWDVLGGLMAVGSGSATDGRWRDLRGRPTILQRGLRYRLNAVCQYLGARLTGRPPASGFLFPSEQDSLDCAMDPAPSGRFTHDRTRLVVTSMPGDIGGLSDDFARSWGYGWGVQFPVPAGLSPSHEPSASHLYQGGLMIARAPDRVLSGGTLRGVAICDPLCRNLGLDARVGSRSAGDSGSQVVWQYSDSGAPEAMGLGVKQESYDGRPPHDYVLFRFRMTNASPRRTTFHAGFFGDWDLGANAEDDVGFTDMGGRLMYLTNGGRTDPFLGTLLVSDVPISGNFFFRKESLLSRSEQFDALAGRVVRPEADLTGDARYIHGAGPFTLDPEESDDLWIAVVAGETRDLLFSSAAAAAADIAQRRRR